MFPVLDLYWYSCILRILRRLATPAHAASPPAKKNTFDLIF